MPAKKILLFIASEKGYTALTQVLLGRYQSRVGCVVTFPEVDVEKSWDIDISAICEKMAVPCFMWQSVKSKIIDIIQEYHITGAVALSWKYLLPLTINDFMEDQMIVFHDSLLPKYRGFAPTPTAIMCGETRVGVTALYATDQVDQGDILLQTELQISDQMYIADIIKAEADIYGSMLETMIEKMESGTLKGSPQNEEDATYSIWRNVNDCHIDWGKSAKEIYNFIRAVGSPYPGAFCFYEQEKIKIVRAEVMPKDMIFSVRDAGKIWSIRDNVPEVICGVGMLKILSAVDEGGHAVSFNRVRCRLE